MGPTVLFRNRAYPFSLIPFNVIRGLIIKFTNSPPCACRGSSEEKPRYGLMTLAYQLFTAVLLLIYLFLSGVYYCLSVFWCAVARMSELLVKLGKSGSEITDMLVQVL
jgi:hypothetical protein